MEWNSYKERTGGGAEGEEIPVIRQSAPIFYRVHRSGYTVREYSNCYRVHTSYSETVADMAADIGQQALGKENLGSPGKRVD